jgi:hypothetical protein
MINSTGLSDKKLANAAVNVCDSKPDGRIATAVAHAERRARVRRR